MCDTYIVSVPTPYDKLDKKIDPCYVIAACKTVLEVAPKGAVLVIESTISPNTVDRFVRPLLIEAEREDVKLVHAPERIIPGNMVYELLHINPTIVAHAENTISNARFTKWYPSRPSTPSGSYSRTLSAGAARDPSTSLPTVASLRMTAWRTPPVAFLG